MPNNNLLMQYLSGLGSAIGQDKSIAGSLDAITQQNISAQSQAGLIGIFKKMLSGEMGDAKATVGSKGFNMNLPPHMASKMFGVVDKEGTMGTPGAPASGPSGGGGLGVESPNQVPTMSNAPIYPEEETSLGRSLNPSISQPEITASDVAGLTPENVSAALRGALSIEELTQKKESSLTEEKYKKALIKESQARAGEIGKESELDKNFPIEHPEAGTLTLRQWKSLPSDERSFASYVYEAKKLGAPPEELTRKFFSALEPTDKEQFLRAAMKDPKLMEAEKKLRKSGATSINIGERTFEAARAKQQAKVMGPDLEVDVRKELMEDSKNWRSTSEADEYSKSKGVPFDDARTHIQKRKVLKGMDRKIRSVFTGKKVEVRIDGWYVDGKLIQRNPYYEE